MKLGKSDPVVDARTLHLANYLTPTLPKPPAELNLADRVSTPWGMMDNDSVGDCTCAAAAHLVMLWSAMAGAERVPLDSDVLSMYSAITGYDPSKTRPDGSNPTDNGAVCLDVLNYWRQNPLDGVAPNAFVKLNHRDRSHYQSAVQLFAGAYLGVQLPLSAQDQIGKVWTVDHSENGQPGSWGGHCVPVVGYDGQGVYLVTWGSLQKATWDFLRVYADEAFAVLPSDWLMPANNGDGPTGFDLPTLQKDLSQLGR